MDTFDIAVVACALCGVFMVLGGIFLLYEGRVRPEAAAQDEALQIEFLKEVTLSTRYPALGLFVIGLAFSFGTLYYAKPATVQPLIFNGSVAGPASSSATISVRPSTPWSLAADSSGIVRGQIDPNPHYLTIEATAPGYRPVTKTVEQSNPIDFGTLAFDHPVAERIPGLDLDRIAPLPAGYTAPPPDQGSFGGAS